MSDKEIEKVKLHIKSIVYSAYKQRRIDIKLAKAVKHFNKIGLEAQSFFLACEGYENSYCHRTAFRVEERGKELIKEISTKIVRQ